MGLGLTLLQGFWGEDWGIVNTETCDSAMREGHFLVTKRLSLGRAWKEGQSWDSLTSVEVHHDVRR